WPFAAAFVVAAALPTLLAPRSEAAAARSARPNEVTAVLAVVLGIAIVVALPWWRPADPLTGRIGLVSYAPSGLAQAMRGAAKPGDRVFTPQTWASWFEWAAPDQRYFLDSRFELFPTPVWDDYDTIIRGGADAQAVLDRWGVTLIVVATGEQPPTGTWTAVFHDADGDVLVRATP
ncbi:MAG TPA: hypothetical protein VGM28_10340, partial [Candidatus Limnocylindrales bacterium]